MQPPDVLDAPPSEKGVLSEKERRFEYIRQRTGFIAAPVLFLLVWFLPIAGLEPAAHRLLAILAVVVTLWLTEAIPLAVTALLGPCLCVLFGIGSARNVFKSFADPIIFLFIGSFLLAEAIFHHGLNRRIAFQILGLRSVGDSPARLMLAFGCITCVLSMWISNSTTTAMMYPVGISILSEMARRRSRQTGADVEFRELKFGASLMLMAAFGSVVGGFATPVGSAPNLIAIGMIRESANVEVPFFKWMGFGVPLALGLLAFLVFFFNRVAALEPDLMQGNTAWIQAEKAKLGSLSRGEKNVLVAFGCTLMFWLLPGVLALVGGTETPIYKTLTDRLPESMVALLGAVLLFVLPINARARQFTLSWNEAKRIDWGTILLFGGGMALGELMFSTGLANWMGSGLAAAMNLHTTFGLVVLFAVISSTVTQVTSNTATASMAVPVAIAVAKAAGLSPLQPALAACLGAGLGCMFPVSTPPTAIVYGSGCIPLMKMFKYGFALNVAGLVVIIVVVMWLVPLFF